MLKQFLPTTTTQKMPKREGKAHIPVSNKFPQKLHLLDSSIVSMFYHRNFINQVYWKPFCLTQAKVSRKLLLWIHIHKSDFVLKRKDSWLLFSSSAPSRVKRRRSQSSTSSIWNISWSQRERMNQSWTTPQAASFLSFVFICFHLHPHPKYALATTSKVQKNQFQGIHVLFMPKPKKKQLFTTCYKVFCSFIMKRCQRNPDCCLYV